MEDYDARTQNAIGKEVLKPYLNELFSHLYQRQQVNDQDQGSCSGITKITFKDYCCLPGVLYERFFHVIDSDSDGFITRTEFVENIALVYLGDLNIKLFLTYQIYDMDRDGKISPEDIRFVLSHIPFIRSIEEQTPESLGIRQKHFFQEGQYNKEDGKITLYKDRIFD